jgi:hypothetical protein
LPSSSASIPSGMESEQNRGRGTTGERATDGMMAKCLSRPRTLSRAARSMQEEVAYGMLDDGPVVVSDHVTDASVLLSHREREVARLIARGYTNRNIAEELVIAESTAERHAEHLFEARRPLAGADRRVGRRAPTHQYVESSARVCIPRMVDTPDGDRDPAP